MLSKIAFTVIFLTLTNSAFSQRGREIDPYPYAAATREDSIQNIAKRVRELLDTQRFFEKSYLRQELVYLPLPAGYNSLFQQRPFYLFSELSKQPTPDNQFRKIKRKANKQLKLAIKSQNELVEEENKRALQLKGDNPSAQIIRLGIKERQDYVFLFCPESIFSTLDNADPRNNRIIDSLSKAAQQIYLGKPHSIEGYVSSINYNAFNFDREMPVMIQKLLLEALRLNKEIIRKQEYRAMVDKVSISWSDLKGSNKLWMYTDEVRKVVYISPYLIRAVFNISLYQNELIRLADDVKRNGGDVTGFLRGKIGASAKEINDAYFNKFAKAFSDNFFFLIGHELAHIYLRGQRLSCDVEMECDAYSAYYNLLEFNDVDPGIFEVLLIRAVKTNELTFWGDDISVADLQERYNNLLKLKTAKTQEGSACPVKEI